MSSDLLESEYDDGYANTSDAEVSEEEDEDAVNYTAPRDSTEATITPTTLSGDGEAGEAGALETGTTALVGGSEGAHAPSGARSGVGRSTTGVPGLRERRTVRAPYTRYQTRQTASALPPTKLPTWENSGNEAASAQASSAATRYEQQHEHLRRQRDSLRRVRVMTASCVPVR